MIKIIIVCVLGGLGAGLGTGFAGLSAACFITPMLVAFLDVPTFEAVGIALSSDVLASAISAYTYGKAGNIDIKRGRVLLISVIVCTILGSGIAYLFSSTETGNAALGYVSILSALFLGIKFIINPRSPNPSANAKNLAGKIGISIAVGCIIGLICGFQGAGGGMMMLFALVAVMMFEMKCAVGTSVFIMTFTALIGAITHFMMFGKPNYIYLILCIVSTFIFARIGAVWANKLSAKASYRIVGVILAVSGVAMLISKLFF